MCIRDSTIGVRRVVAKKIVSRATQLASDIGREGIGRGLGSIPRVIYVARRLLSELVDELLRDLPAEVEEQPVVDRLERAECVERTLRLVAIVAG